MTLVMGAGAFGTALAISLAGAGGAVTLWARDRDQVAAMRDRRENAARLPGIPLPETVTPVETVQAGEPPVLLAVPMQKLRDLLTAEGRALRGRTLVACCKGIELSTGKGPLAVIEEVLPGAPSALLTGPSFARDIAQGLPTALTLACADAADGARLQKALSTRNLRLYRTTDTIGAELGGALKNVIAIACGAAIGAGFGESARAAVMTRGYAEMQRLALRRGAQPETLAGLSGFGDLTLTCTSEQSRNYRLGLSLGRGEAFDPSVTVEGAATARAVAELAAAQGMDMPITAVVVGMVDGNMDATGALDRLLSRPLKEE